MTVATTTRAAPVASTTGPTRTSVKAWLLPVVATLAAAVWVVSGFEVRGVSAGALVTVLGCAVLWVVLLAEGSRVVPVAAVMGTLIVASLAWQLAAGIGSTLTLGAVQQGVVWFATAAGVMAASTMRRAELARAVRVADRSFIAATWVMAGAWVSYNVGLLEGTGGPRIVALGALVPLVWFLASWQRRGDRAARYALVHVVLILSTMSRTASACALLLLVASRPTSEPSQQRARLALSVGIGAATWWALSRSELVRSRFFAGDVSLDLGPVTINGMGRTRMWTTAWEGSLDALWTGHGLGTVRGLMVQLAPNIGHPHQDYLRLLYEGGVVALALWIVLVVVALRALRRSHRATAGTSLRVLPRCGVLLLLAVSLTALTDNSLVYPTMLIPLGIFLGLGVAAGRRTSASAGERAT